MLVFHLETHPNYTCYTQCVTFNFFPSYVHEISYSLFSMLIMYWFPLIVIFYTYSSIFMEICRRSKEKSEGTADMIYRATRIIFKTYTRFIMKTHFTCKHTLNHTYTYTKCCIISLFILFYSQSPLEWHVI